MDEKSFKHNPGCTRPARPLLCFVLAREHHVETSLLVAVRLSYCISLTRPESITSKVEMRKLKATGKGRYYLPHTTSGIVTLVSAMFVLRIIF